MMRAPRRDVISTVAASLLLFLYADRSEGFGPTAISRSADVRCRPPIRHRVAAAAGDGEKTAKEDWTLEQDWALADRVPAFTIGKSDGARRTFWIQLLVCTPELDSRWSEEDAASRYGTLRSLDATGTLPAAGPSPPLLRDWSVGTDGRMTGVLDGRTVWFVTHVVGRVDGVAASSEESLSGGFVEAVGGRVYELGRPAENGKGAAATAAEGANVGGYGQINPNPFDKLSNSFEKLPWMPAATMTLSALFASTILSLAVGYGAGLSVATDNARQARLPPQQTVQRNLRVVVVDQTNGGGRLQQRTSAEKRAIKEAQVLAEQRRSNFLLEKIEKDQVELQQLRIDEKNELSSESQQLQ